MTPEVVQVNPALPWLAPFPSELFNKVCTLPHEALLVWLNQQSSARSVVCGNDRPLQFVPQDLLPTGAAYETWIAETGCVPTRDNLHDRYNALMWLCCPATKARLNHVQAAQLSLRGGTGARGPVRDAATLWDENLLVVVCSGDADTMLALLSAADWSALFLQHRQRWYQDWHPMVFGHALLEKLQHPYKSITAHCVVISAPAPQWTLVDTQLAQRVSTELAPKALRPLPVMGIPGWHPENVALSFYQDAAVFRSRRRP